MTRTLKKLQTLLKIFVLTTKYISSFPIPEVKICKLNDKLFSLYIFLNTFFTVSSLTVE